MALDDFLHLVGWFGPFRKGGCLTKVMKISGVYECGAVNI